MKPNVLCARGCLYPFQEINRSLMFSKNGYDAWTRTLGNSSSASQTKTAKRMRRKEQQRQCLMNWPQLPFLVPLNHSRRGGTEYGSKVEPGKKAGVEGKGVLRSGFISHYPALIW